MLLILITFGAARCFITRHMVDPEQLAEGYLSLVPASFSNRHGQSHATAPF